MPGLFDKSLESLKSVMDYRLFRQGVIASNVANVDTPGYKAKDAAFEKEFDSRLRMETTNPAHISGSKASAPAYKVVDDPFSRIGNDGNTVDIDREMMKLSQNQLLYTAAAQDVAKKFEGLKNIISNIR